MTVVRPDSVSQLWILSNVLFLFFGQIRSYLTCMSAAVCEIVVVIRPYALPIVLKSQACSSECNAFNLSSLELTKYLLWCFSFPL